MKLRNTILIALLSIWLHSTSAQFFSEDGLKILKLYSLIEGQYVDTVNIGKITDEMIIETLRKLDPHSKYIPKSEAKAATEQIEGNFEGVGITYNLFNDTLFVVSVINGGPSQKIGIRAGDRIITVDSQCVAGTKISSKQVMQKLRGKKGSVVNLGIKRRGEKGLLNYTVIRDRIPIFSIDASYKVDKTTGYIKLARFAATTSDELNAALSKFKDDNIENIILDLTDNGGGLLDIAVKMADEFLDSGKLVVYIKGVHSNQKNFISTTKGSFEKGKLVVIIDENSASASEIFAGAIQDWDRGVIVGRRSFGKGLVQNQFPFPDGSIVRLTTARYYTPTGRLIQKPYTDNFADYSRDISKRLKHGELYNKDSIHFPDSLKYYTLIKKHLVYGGGGIMPDVFVPIDTLDTSTYFRNLVRSSHLQNYTIDYIDKNRTILIKKYPSFVKYRDKFEVSDQQLSEIANYATQKGLKFNEAEFNQSKKKIAHLFKATLARDLWGSSEFYEIYNTTNSNYIKAMEVMKDLTNSEKPYVEK